MSPSAACAQGALSLHILDVTNTVERTEHLPSFSTCSPLLDQDGMYLHSEIIPTSAGTLPATKPPPTPVARHAILHITPMTALQQIRSLLDSLLTYQTIVFSDLQPPSV